MIYDEVSPSSVSVKCVKFLSNFYYIYISHDKELKLYKDSNSLYDLNVFIGSQSLMFIRIKSLT